MYQHIKDLREDKDLTQQQIAELLNISQTTYSRYESGVLDIPSSSLISLAKFYRTSVDYLLDLTKNKTPYDK
ncbi:MAG: helix-turn-helix domain-containing protein [Intestinimonas sp.]|nr:helix-turn-helix domain-containing protein [Intestinimonas sp.]